MPSLKCRPVFVAQNGALLQADQDTVPVSPHEPKKLSVLVSLLSEAVDRHQQTPLNPDKDTDSD